MIYRIMDQMYQKVKPGGWLLIACTNGLIAQSSSSSSPALLENHLRSVGDNDYKTLRDIVETELIATF